MDGWVHNVVLDDYNGWTFLLGIFEEGSRSRFISECLARPVPGRLLEK